MKTIGLVDFSHTLRVNYHVRPEDGAPMSAGSKTLAQLSDWRRGLDHVIVCLDSPPYDRSTVYPEYKAGRARDEGYIQVCKWTKERLVKDGYSIASHPGAEADDVIATLAYKLPIEDVRIFGGDKDCLQCVAERGLCKVRVLAPGPRGDFEKRDVEWVKQKWGISPGQVPLFLAICGDKSDNIPGIMGIGEKGASKLIQEFGTIEKMRMAAVDAFTASKQEGAKPLSAFWDKFLKGSPRLPEWLALTTLRTDLPLDVDSLLVKRAPLPLVVESPEDIEHGDAWEPSADELQEERAMLDPEVVISGPKNLGGLSDASTAAPSAVPRTTSEPNASTQNTAEASSKKVAAGPAESTPPARAGLKMPGPKFPERDDGTAPAVKPPRTSDEPASIVVARPPAPNWALQLQPATAGEARRIADTLMNSRLVSKYGNPEGVYAVISLGRELGLGMMQALQGFHIVQDRPFPSAPMLQALAESDPNCEWLVCTESTDERATWRTKHRKAGELEFTYTRAEAQKNGCYNSGNKHNWNSRERQMLRKTCMANAVRIWYPRAVMGLHIEEEWTDE